MVVIVLVLEVALGVLELEFAPTVRPRFAVVDAEEEEEEGRENTGLRIVLEPATLVLLEICEENLLAL